MEHFICIYLYLSCPKIGNSKDKKKESDNIKREKLKSNLRRIKKMQII